MAKSKGTHRGQGKGWRKGLKTGGKKVTTQITSGSKGSNRNRRSGHIGY